MIMRLTKIITKIIFAYSFKSQYLILLRSKKFVINSLLCFIIYNFLETHSLLSENGLLQLYQVRYWFKKVSGSAAYVSVQIISRLLHRLPKGF